MAQILCADVLGAFDKEWNQGPSPLEPNWHTFASYLERAVITAHKRDDTETLDAYFAFLNWALYEPTSYIRHEVIVTGFEGIACELAPSAWMKYVPMPKLKNVILPWMTTYFPASISKAMRDEMTILSADSSAHRASWMPLHQRFTEIAENNDIPFDNSL